MERTKVIILGGLGTAINIAEGLYDAQHKHNAPVEFIGFAFDDEKSGDSINGFPRLCGTKEAWKLYENQPDVKFIFQMNHQEKMVERAQLIEEYGIPPSRWFTFIHPTAYVARSVEIGYGTVVFAGCAIHSNARIGNHCTFSALTTIGHDTVVGNHVFTATHVCIGSSVQMGENLFIGQNVTITAGVKIGANNLLGLGTTIIKDISEVNKVIVGHPGKILRDIKR